MWSSLRSVLDDLWIKDVNSIPEWTESDILQMVRARKPVAPKKFMEGLSEGKPVSPKTKIDDTLLQEAKKYKTADEFMNGKAYTDYWFLLKEWDSIKYRTTNGVFTAKIESIKNTLHTDNSYVNSDSQNIIADFWNWTKKNISSTDHIAEINGKPHEWSYKRKIFADFKQIREQANKKPLPAKWLPKLWKEIMEQNIAKTDNLISEAKKYKSAENFTKSQWKALYHGSKASSNIEKEWFKKMPIQTGVPAFGEGTYLTTSKANAKWYGWVVEAYIPKDIKLFRAFDSNAYKLDTQKLIKEWYWGVELDTGNGKNITIFDPASIKTKSQLKQIREQANKKPLPAKWMPKLPKGEVLEQNLPIEKKDWITLYHWTDKQFDKFLESKMWAWEGSDLYGKGVYLTDSKDLAKSYANLIAKNKNPATKSAPTGIFSTDVPVYPKNIDKLIEGNRNLIETNIKGKVLDTDTFKIPNDLRKVIVDSHAKNFGLWNNTSERIVWRVFDYMDSNSKNINNWKWQLDYVIKQIWDKWVTSDIMKYIKDKGYDGIKYASDTKFMKAPWTNYMIFDPTKVKILKNTLFSMFWPVIWWGILLWMMNDDN